MIEPAKSALEITLMFGGLAELVYGLYMLDHSTKWHMRSFHALLCLTGLAMMTIGVTMGMIDIIYLGYQ